MGSGGAFRRSMVDLGITEESISADPRNCEFIYGICQSAIVSGRKLRQRSTSQGPCWRKSMLFEDSRNEIPGSGRLHHETEGMLRTYAVDLVLPLLGSFR
jgi:hypothetical protein